MKGWLFIVVITLVSVLSTIAGARMLYYIIQGARNANV